MQYHLVALEQYEMALAIVKKRLIQREEIKKKQKNMQRGTMMVIMKVLLYVINKVIKMQYKIAVYNNNKPILLTIRGRNIETIGYISSRKGNNMRRSCLLPNKTTVRFFSFYVDSA